MVHTSTLHQGLFQTLPHIGHAWLVCTVIVEFAFSLLFLLNVRSQTEAEIGVHCEDGTLAKDVLGLSISSKSLLLIYKEKEVETTS